MSVIWGMPYLFIKVADGGVSVPVLVFSRLAVAAALLLPLAIRRRQIAGLWRHWRWLLLFATVEMIIPWALLSDAERHLSSSMTGLLVASVPIIGVVLVRLTGGTERLTAARWAGRPGWRCWPGGTLSAATPGRWPRSCSSPCATRPARLSSTASSASFRAWGSTPSA